MAYNPRMSIIPPAQTQSRTRKKEEEADAFMRLPDREIVGCITDIGIPFTVADLQKPNPLQVQMIFLAACCAIGAHASALIQYGDFWLHSDCILVIWIHSAPIEHPSIRFCGVQTRHMRVDVELASPLSYGQTVCDIWSSSGRPPNVHVALVGLLLSFD